MAGIKKHQNRVAGAFAGLYNFSMPKKPRPKTPTPSTEPKRKGGYPYYPFRSCLKVAAIVKNHGGDRAAVPKSVIAKELGQSKASSGFALLSASAKTFGMVTGQGEFQLTTLGRSYFFPTSDRESRQAELAFLIEPDVFRELVKKLDGSKLPNSGILANILGQMGVTESWRPRIAQIFASTAAELQVLDGAGFLRYEAACHSAGPGGPRNYPPEEQSPRVIKGMPGVQEEPVVPSPVAARTVGSAAVVDASDRNVWQFTESGGTVRLETPDPLPMALWLRLKKYVEVLEPEESQGG